MIDSADFELIMIRAVPERMGLGEGVAFTSKFDQLMRYPHRFVLHPYQICARREISDVDRLFFSASDLYRQQWQPSCVKNFDGAPDGVADGQHIARWVGVYFYFCGQVNFLCAVDQAWRLHAPVLVQFDDKAMSLVKVIVFYIPRSNDIGINSEVAYSQ